jgi:galactonate dehydratase
MKIAAIEDLHCGAGWRDLNFLKIVTDTGIVGYSEYLEGFGSPGLTGVIHRLLPLVMGEDPRPVERIVANLRSVTRPVPGGLAAQAIAAFENALYDIKAKDLGVPVSALFGGPHRDRLPVYWSHCGTFRLNHHKAMGKPQPRSLDDIRALGAEVKASGVNSLKTNIFLFDGDEPEVYMPGFGRSQGAPELNGEAWLIDLIVKQMEAFREGAGPDIGLKLDLNFNFKTEGYIRVAQALAHLNMDWLELDIFEPAALKAVRDRAPMSIASLESLYGRRQFKPYFDAGAVDVCIVDVPWNGIAESIRVANLAEIYEINVAAHNFNGHLGTLMGAHFCAAVPNFRVVETDYEDVTWKDEIFTHVPVIEDGMLILPDTPGWGTDINEAALAKYPPRDTLWIGGGKWD